MSTEFITELQENTSEFTQSPSSERILILTTGSRGDVQPFVALANRLAQLQNNVAIVTHENFGDYFKQHADPAVRFYPLEGDFSAIISSPQMEDALYYGGTSGLLKAMMAEMNKYLPQNMLHIANYVEEFQPTALVSGIVDVGTVAAISEKKWIPYSIASTVPFFPSGFTLPVALGMEPFKYTWINRFIHEWGAKIGWILMLRENINKFRAIIGLPPAPGLEVTRILSLYMFSPAVVPRPIDLPNNVVETGYWTLPLKSNYQPDLALDSYLNDGEPPIYCGFGSMPVKDKQGFLDKFSRVLQHINKRGIFCGGWTATHDLSVPETVFVVQDVPHEWLFPRCLAAIHHGGAGTTAASLRAGIPTLILPFLIDQPYWASRVKQIAGVAYDIHPYKDVTEVYLRERLTQLLQPNVVENFKRVGELLHQENGIEKAAQSLQKYFAEMKAAQQPGTGCFQLPEQVVNSCEACRVGFSFLRRRNQCTSCGKTFCAICLRSYQLPNYTKPQNCCRQCGKTRALLQVGTIIPN